MDNVNQDMADLLLSRSELEIWRGFLRFSEQVVSDVGQALVNETPLTATDYEVLKRLLEAGGTLPQSTLQQSLQWSASRLSHQLRRMDDRSLLGRTEAGQGRAVNVAIMEGGRAAMAIAEVVHARAVRTALLHRINQVNAKLFSDAFLAPPH